jgi:hypothetical protein
MTNFSNVILPIIGGVGANSSSMVPITCDPNDTTGAIGGAGGSALPTLSTDYAAAEFDDKTTAKTLATSAALIVSDGFSTQTNTVSTYTDESQIDSQFGFGVNFSTGRGMLFSPSSDQRELLARDGFVIGCSVGKNMADINTTVSQLIYVASYGSGGNSGHLSKRTNGGWDVNFPQSSGGFAVLKIATDDKEPSVDITVAANPLKTYNWSANGSSLTVSETGHTRKVGDYVVLQNGRITVATGTAPVTGRYCIASVVAGVSWTANRYVTGNTDANNATCIRSGGATVAGDTAVAVTGTGTLQLADVFVYVDGLEFIATTRVDKPDAKHETPTNLAKIVFGGLDTLTTWQGGGTNNNRMNGAFIINRRSVRNTVNQIINSVGFLGTSFYANAGPSDSVADVANAPYWFCGQGFNANVLSLAYAVVSNICTVTETAHTRLQGQTVYIDTTTGLMPAGDYQITSTATNSWTFAVTTADTTGTTSVCGRATIPTTALDNDSARHDTGVICQVFRTLAKNGYYPNANSNSDRRIGNNRSQSGGFITDAIKQANFWGNTPDLVFINLGTNEAANYASFPVDVFETNYKKLLLKLARQGVKYVVLQNVLSLSAMPLYASSAVEKYVVSINNVISNLQSWALVNTPSLRVGVDDCYAAFGGASPNLGWFKTANIHPNCAGSSKLGISAGLKAVELLS